MWSRGGGKIGSGVRVGGSGERGQHSRCAGRWALQARDWLRVPPPGRTQGEKKEDKSAHKRARLCPPASRSPKARERFSEGCRKKTVVAKKIATHKTPKRMGGEGPKEREYKHRPSARHEAGVGDKKAQDGRKGVGGRFFWPAGAGEQLLPSLSAANTGGGPYFHREKERGCWGEGAK